MTGPNGTTTGPLTVGIGEGTVSETPAPAPTSATTTRRSTAPETAQPVVSVPGTKVDGAIANGDVVVCTFTNTRTAPLRPAAAAATADPPTAAGPADPGAAAPTDGRPERAQDGHAGDRGARTHDHVPDHGDEPLARRRRPT